ncbi:MAG: TatD family hydrolase [Lachnospiraceae bacterium]|nr:TatD family hydrolase [Lachnospiraceae bacterium]
MIFDTHAHYDDEAFDEDRKELLLRMKESGIGTIVNIGASIESSKMTLALAEEYPFIYGALGVHPSEVEELDEELFQWLKATCAGQSVAKGGKIVAVGEIGLDYYWNDEDEPDREIQKKWFEKQIEMAKEEKLPIIIHSREAAKDTYDIVKTLHAGENGGIVHCYSYSKELAKEFLSMGFHFGIGGVLTFKNARKLREVVEYLPMESIVLETDSPYLSPVPHRGERNSSLNLPYVIQTLSEMKGIEEERIIEITENNAKKLFAL